MIVSDPIRITGAERFGVDPGSMKSLGGEDGAVYACRREDRGHALKFVPIKVEDVPAYEEKARFFRYLAENGVSIALPLESQSGCQYELVQGEETLYLVTLTILADGRHPEPRNLYDWDERLFGLWGQVMGKMHALARCYPTWEKPEPGTDSASPQTLLNGWQEEQEFFAAWCKEPKIVARWRQLEDPLRMLPRDRSCYGLIHNDPHQWNFLYNPDAHGVHPITIIDFDVCCYHWFITDIAIPVYHAITYGKVKSISERRAAARPFLASFLQGYRQENDLDKSWLEHLPLFLKYREILIYIALSNSWPEESRNAWQRQFLAVKRGRTLRGEPIL